jgi:hypothetical protein
MAAGQLGHARVMHRARARAETCWPVMHMPMPVVQIRMPLVELPSETCRATSQAKSG